MAPVVYALRRTMIRDGIHDSGCSLKICRRECFTNINLYGEMHRFIPAVFMFITGVELFVSGLMANMLAKTYFASTRDVSYSRYGLLKNGNKSRDKFCHRRA